MVTVKVGYKSIGYSYGLGVKHSLKTLYAEVLCVSLYNFGKCGLGEGSRYCKCAVSGCLLVFSLFSSVFPHYCEVRRSAPLHPFDHVVVLSHRLGPMGPQEQGLQCPPLEQNQTFLHLSLFSWLFCHSDEMITNMTVFSLFLPIFKMHLLNFHISVCVCVLNFDPVVYST